jgi:PKD repeat protein
MSVPPGTPNGELPAGLTFTTSTDQGGSTAIISGIDTTSGTNGTYTITLTASNDAGSSVTPITLLVEPAVSLSIR